MKAVKRILALILAVTLMITLMPLSAQAVKNKTACFVSDYRKWNQGESAYSEMREVGCLITAQAKMLYEENINRGAMNPDFWYEWLWGHGGLINPPYNIGLTASGVVAPATYAASLGKNIEYLGYWDASDYQLWWNINHGYYSIVNVGGHWVMVDNTTSLSTGQIYIYDSYNRGSNDSQSWAIYNQFTWNDSPCRISKYGSKRPGAHVYKASNPVVVIPGTPSNVSLNTQNAGVGDALTAVWSAVPGADSYRVNLVCTSNSSLNQSQTVSGTSASFSLNSEGTYQVTVSAVNTAGTGSAAASGTCTVKPNVTVTYQDYDGTVLSSQSVKYGGSAVAPSAPEREGYTFQSWSSDGKNVTADITITAEYKINTYSVSFVDYEGNVIDRVQKVEYGSAATPPAEVPTETGYVFSGWNTDSYQSVKSNLKVQAVYVWGNTDLPVVAEITGAVRNEEATGYSVSVKLKNFPNDFTKGKLVAALKTKSGKLLASEIDSVSVPVSGEVTKDIFILYSGVASQVEVSLLGVTDDDTTGTPKAKTVSANIDLGEEWSDWSGNPAPEGTNIMSESRTEYRYKTRKVIKATTKPSTPAGYTYVGSSATGTYTNWGAWSGWSDVPRYADTLTNVQTCTGYRYFAFVCSNCGQRDDLSGACSNCGQYTLNWVQAWGTCRGYDYSPGWTKFSSTRGRIYWQNAYWYFELDGTHNGIDWSGQVTTTLYQYQTRQQYYDYEYWTTDFSNWQETPVAADSNTQVETRTAYRFKTNSTEVPCFNYKRYKYENVNTGKTVYSYTRAYADSMEYPGEWEYNKSFTELSQIATVDDGIVLYNGYGDQSWYRADVNQEGTVTEYETTSSLEDNIGAEKTIAGKLEGCEGKMATLLVYKGQNSDPTASQIEYIGQTTIGEDGSYSFTYVTKEEPTAKTGDFVVTLGVEGSTNYMEIDRIEAPKAVYTVDFVDDEGNSIGESQKVVDGQAAVAPEAPEKEGYEFIGWDTGLKNVRDNMLITAQYRKKMYTVIFADWDNTSLSVREYEYGAELTTDNLPEKAGQRFDKWLDQDGNEAVYVTGNMIVFASYTDTKYAVTFTDWDGNIIKTVEAEYGEQVELPENLADADDGRVFENWEDVEKTYFVANSVTIKPVGRYVKTAEMPLFTLESGTYGTAQTLGLYSLNSDVEIYYSVEPVSEEEGASNYVNYDAFTRYSEPVTISQSSVISAYAKSSNANNSEVNAVKIEISRAGQGGNVTVPSDSSNTGNNSDNGSKTPAPDTGTVPGTDSGKITVSGGVYKALGNGKAAYVTCKNKKAKKATVLASVTIDGKKCTVTEIQANAFKNCKKLKNIVIKSTKLKKVGKKAFKGIYKKAKIKVPKSKLKAYKKLLKAKGQAKTVKIVK